MWRNKKIDRHRVIFLGCRLAGRRLFVFIAVTFLFLLTCSNLLVQSEAAKFASRFLSRSPSLLLCPGPAGFSNLVGHIAAFSILLFQPGEAQVFSFLHEKHGLWVRSCTAPCLHLSLQEDVVRMNSYNTREAAYLHLTQRASSGVGEGSFHSS